MKLTFLIKFFAEKKVNNDRKQDVFLLKLL